MIAAARPGALPFSLAAADPRSRLRLRSLGWALLAGTTAAGLGLPGGLEPALRAGGCGFFYGLLAFHLQRVDPDDGHLQAGLVGAVCGIRSLGAPFPLPPLAGAAGGAGERLPALTQLLPQALAQAGSLWVPLWLPLLGSALVLQGAQRLWPGLRP